MQAPMYYILGSCLNEQYVCLYISLGMKFSLMYVKEPCLWLLLAHNSVFDVELGSKKGLSPKPKPVTRKASPSPSTTSLCLLSQGATKRRIVTYYIGLW